MVVHVIARFPDKDSPHIGHTPDLELQQHEDITKQLVIKINNHVHDLTIIFLITVLNFNK